MPPQPSAGWLIRPANELLRREVVQLLEQVLHEVLEAEIADHLGGESHERTDGRRG